MFVGDGDSSNIRSCCIADAACYQGSNSAEPFDFIFFVRSAEEQGTFGRNYLECTTRLSLAFIHS